MMTLSSLSKSRIGSIITAIAQAVALGLLLSGVASDLVPMIVAFGVLVSVASVFFAMRSARAVHQIADVSHKVAGGDFEQRIVLLGDQGDLRHLADSINELIDRTDAYMREAGAAMETVAANRYNRLIVERGLVGAYLRGGKIINRAITETHNKVQKFKGVAELFEKSMGTVASSMSEASGTLGSTAQTMDEDATATSRRALEASGAADTAADSVSKVAAATEELTASIQAIREQVGRSSAITQNIVAGIADTRSTVDGLKGAADRIGHVVQLIAELSSQTNLLALNATIEAARAGEFGKGFAVVASEVKLLADNTSKATEEIRREVESIQEATSNAVHQFGDIAETVSSVEEASHAITIAIDEQAQATAEIAGSVSTASAGVQDVSGNVNAVSSSAEATQCAAAAVLEASTAISQNSSRLAKEVEDFLVEVRAVA